MKAVKIAPKASNVVTLKAKTLESLTKALQQARAEVEQANNKKLQIELEIYNFIKNDYKLSGTTNFPSGLKVVSSLNYKVDQDKVMEILENVELPINVFRTKIEVSAPKLKELQEVYPEYYAMIADAISVQPNKPYMTVKDNDSN